MDKNKEILEIKDVEFQEEYISNGPEYPDKLFYVVRRFVKYEGICSVINSFIGHFSYIEEMKKNTDKEVIPLVDMLHYHSNLWKMDDLKNDWELFFKQPQTDYRLEHLEQAQNVLLGSGFLWIVNAGNIYFRKELLQRCNELFRKYIHANEQLEKNIELWRKRIFIADRKVIGCFFRMGIVAGQALEKNLGKEKSEELDLLLFNGWNMKNYPENPTKEEIVDILKKYLAKWNATHIFVSIDDEETLEYLKETMGDTILYVTRNRPQFYENGNPKLEIYEKEFMEVEGEERFNRNLGYLTEIYLLAECQSLICGCSSGAATAAIINGNQYQHIYYFSELYRYLDQNRLWKFCTDSSEIYIFGAGYWGVYIANYLTERNIIFKGFLVSDGNAEFRSLMEHPVYQITEVDFNSRTGIIVGVKKSRDIVDMLENKGVKNYFLISQPDDV